LVELIEQKEPKRKEFENKINMIDDLTNIKEHSFAPIFREVKLRLELNRLNDLRN
jgi:hypothetical protein